MTRGVWEATRQHPGGYQRHMKDIGWSTTNMAVDGDCCEINVYCFLLLAIEKKSERLRWELNPRMADLQLGIFAGQYAEKPFSSSNS